MIQNQVSQSLHNLHKISTSTICQPKVKKKKRAELIQKLRPKIKDKRKYGIKDGIKHSNKDGITDDWQQSGVSQDLR